ncbi:MAG: hypothetical protein SNJ77_12800, partial [Cytophagales bacterium]
MKQLKYNTQLLLTLFTLVIFSILPVFFNLPYRVHIYLPFDGAYRFSIGQTPYQDFGMPFGYAFFIIPTLFFKIFGASFISLVYAQVFLNFISCWSLMKILQKLNVNPEVIFLSVFVYCLSYVFIHFWPWHTHTAFTYGLLGIWCFLESIEQEKFFKKLIFVFLSSLFAFLSFFTKQDYGGLAFLFIGILFFADSIFERKFIPLLFYVFSFLIILILNIKTMPVEFAYWFNHGQAPHSSRLGLMNFLQNIFGFSEWEKFYLLLIMLVMIPKLNNFKTFLADKKTVLFFLITTGMIVE